MESTTVKTENLYEILGVRKNASTRSIKKAFRIKVKTLHPDANNGEEAKEYQQVKEAYDILSNPEKRKLYDDTGTIYTKSMEQEVFSNLVGLLNMIISKSNIEKLMRVDLIDILKII